MTTVRHHLWLTTAGFSALLTPYFLSALHPDYHEQINRPDRTAIVTGATGNLGRGISYHLARRNMRVIMACRDLEKCKSIRREIVLHTSNKSVVCRHLDLEDIDSINKFANEVIEKEPHLDILINNAGIKETDGKEMTKYGIEKHLFVNYVAQYLLTIRLLEKLGESASHTKDSRIINVVGTPKKDWAFDLQDPNFETRKFDNKTAYQQSKLALAYFTILLNKLNREKKNYIYVFGFTPTTFRLMESFDRDNSHLHKLKLMVKSYSHRHAEHVLQPVIRCALDPTVINKGSGKLYNYMLTSIGFNGAWGIAAKDETKAKLVWNMAASLLLTGFQTKTPEPDQLKQEEKSNASPDESA